MRINGTPEDILRCADNLVPDADINVILERVKEQIPFIKRQVAPYQGAVLFALANQFNKSHCLILEIGTAWGYSAACISEGAPWAKITTLNPKQGEVGVAQRYLKGYKNVEVFQYTSMEFCKKIKKTDIMFDMIFVDGDHDKVGEDLIWWNRLNKGGLMLFHDYSPDGAGRPCRPVYSTLNDWAFKLDRSFDIEVVDNRNVGMVGLYK